MEPNTKVTYDNFEWTVRQSVGDYTSLIREGEDGNSVLTVVLTRDITLV